MNQEKCKIFQIIFLVMSLSEIFLGQRVYGEVKKDIAVYEILSLVEKAYQNVDTYSDRGKIIEKYCITEFETHYKRSGFYSIRTLENNVGIKDLKKNWICKNRYGTYGYSDWSEKKIVYQYKNLKDVIKSNYLTVKGLAGIITPWLLDEINYKPLTIVLKNPVLVGEEMIDGEKCFHLMLDRIYQNRSKITYHLWVAKNNYWIKKVKMVTPELERTYIFDIVSINKEIPDSIFKCDI